MVTNQHNKPTQKVMKKKQKKTSIILLPNIHLPPTLPDPQLLIPRQRPDAAVVPLVPDRRRGGQHKGRADDHAEEGQAEQQEGPPRHLRPVPRAEGVVGGGRVGRAVFAVGEDRHCFSFVVFFFASRWWVGLGWVRSFVRLFGCCWWSGDGVVWFRERLGIGARDWLRRSVDWAVQASFGGAG